MKSNAFLLTTLCAAGIARGEVAYRETFPVGPDAQANGWRFHMNPDAVEITSGQPGWGGAPGATNEPAVDSNPGDESAAWKGFVWVPQGNPYVLWTDEAAVEGIETISWHMSLGDAGAQVRVALQVDTDGNGRTGNDPWFVSQQVFTDAEGPAIDKSPKQMLAPRRRQHPHHRRRHAAVEACSITTVAAACGYRDVFFFSRHFKKHHGVSPSRFRKSGPKHEAPSAIAAAVRRGDGARQPPCRSGTHMFHRVELFQNPPGPSPVAAKRWVGAPFWISSCGRSKLPCVVVVPSSQRTFRE